MDRHQQKASGGHSWPAACFAQQTGACVSDKKSQLHLYFCYLTFVLISVQFHFYGGHQVLVCLSDCIALWFLTEMSEMNLKRRRFLTSSQTFSSVYTEWLKT